MSRSSNNKVFIGLMIAALVLSMLACSLDLSQLGIGGGNDADATDEPTTPTPIPTFIFITITPTPVEDGGAAPEVPTNTPVPAAPSGPSTTATGAVCLPGTWQIDHESVKNYIILSMIGFEEYGFSAKSVSGKMELQITPGQINILAEGFKVVIGVNVGGVADASLFSVSVNANGSASYTATDSVVSMTSITYNVVGTMESGESGTVSYSMDLDDLLNVAQDLGFAKDLPVPITERQIVYTCAGDTLTIVVNAHATVTFRRVVP